MNKKYFNSIIIVLLILSNLLLLFFLFQKKSHSFDPDRPRNIIIEKLHFDSEQIQSYDQLISHHRSQVNEKDAQILALKTTLYQSLNSNDTSSLDSISSEIGLRQQEIERIHYLHFQEIKHLCKPEQLPYFTALSQDLMEIFHMKKLAKPNNK